jgi:hypothetical protein
MGPALLDYNLRLVQLSVIQLSSGHCILNLTRYFVLILNTVLFAMSLEFLYTNEQMAKFLSSYNEETCTKSLEHVSLENKFFVR